MTCFQATISTPSSTPPTAIAFSIPGNNDDLGNEITRLAGHINAANYRFLKLLAALVDRGAWDGDSGIKSPAHWLNYRCGISLGPAREKVRVALALKNLPLIDAAFARGEISFSKVRAMTRAATPDNEDFLLNIAQHGTASHVEQLVRKYQNVEKLSSDSHGKAQQQARRFSYYYDDDGMLCFRGKLAPEDGAVLVKAMEAVQEKINLETFARERERNDQDVSAETFSRDHAPTAEQKRADALVRIAEQSLQADAAISGGDKYQVVVHINADDGHARTNAYIEDGPVLSPQTVKKLASDASLVPVLEDGKGNVLNVGRKTRTIPPAIKRALSIRDRGCRFPGCCESRFVDAHHIRHWCDGGDTSLDNLVLLCRHHHRLLHEDKFRIENEAAGKPVFIDEDGRKICQAIFPQFTPETHGNNVSAETFLAIEHDHEALGLTIDEHTAVTAWQGETMDYSMAVDALLGRQ